MELLNFNIKNPKAKFTSIFCLLACIVILFGCRKYIEVETPQQLISSENAFKNDQVAASVLTGVYAQLSDGQILFGASMLSTSLIPELSADNLTLYDPIASPNYRDFYKNSLEPRYLNSGNSFAYWYNIYPLVYAVNTAIEGLKDNTVLTTTVKKRLLGEAYFMRGFLYFYLVNFYGGVPLVLSTKYDQTAHLPRNTADEVYSQINSDLALAEGLLDYNYVGANASSTTSDRVRPNLAAVLALEARVFLYEKKYANAEAKATKVISHSSFSLTDLSSTFLKNSLETIWALQPVKIGYNTTEASVFMLPETGPDGSSYPVYASTSLVKSFEPGDNRRNSWLGIVNVEGIEYYYPSKYKLLPAADPVTVTENSIVLRLAEQYLIRAEARNEQGNTEGAVEDLNAIRTRSRAEVTKDVPDPLPNLSTSLTQNQIKPIILNERRVELFAEWGHRWFDLKRSATLDVVMTEEEKVKGGIWSNYKSLYPIYRDEILTNQALRQNPGYTN
jgi:hypothetical protein